MERMTYLTGKDEILAVRLLRFWQSVSKSKILMIALVRISRNLDDVILPMKMK